MWVAADRISSRAKRASKPVVGTQCNRKQLRNALKIVLILSAFAFLGVVFARTFFGAFPVLFP
jgi:hypothetical protein